MTCENCGVQVDTTVERPVFGGGILVCVVCAKLYERHAVSQGGDPSATVDLLHQILEMLDSIDTHLWRMER